MGGPLYNRRQMGIGGQITPNQALAGLCLFIGLSVGNKFGLWEFSCYPCFYNIVCLSNAANRDTFF